jgi:arylsulfatase A-like enzyme
MYDGDESEVTLPGYRVDAQTDGAIRYVDEHQNEPFFLFCSYLEPHHQNRVDDYPAPVGYRQRYEGRWTPPDLIALGGSSQQHLAGYWGMVKRLDEAYGRLLDALQSLELLDDTIVLFTSDHGCHFKTRNSEYKRSCHESSIRVPTVFTGPGFTGGGQLRELVSLIDLPPTLLDAAGIAVPDDMQGRSIMPLLRRQPDADWPSEVFIQISEAEVGRAIRTHRWKYGVTAPGIPGNSVPGASEYVETYLYDLETDPYELNNLVGRSAYRALCDQLGERLLARLVEAGESPATIQPAATIPSGQAYLTEAELLA